MAVERARLAAEVIGIGRSPWVKSTRSCGSRWSWRRTSAAWPRPHAAPQARLQKTSPRFVFGGVFGGRARVL